MNGAFSFDPAFFQFHIKSHEEAKYPGSRGPRERTAVRVSRPARVKEPFRVQPEREERRGNAGGTPGRPPF